MSKQEIAYFIAGPVLFLLALCAFIIGTSRATDKGVPAPEPTPCTTERYSHPAIELWQMRDWCRPPKALSFEGRDVVCSCADGGVG